MLSKVLYKRVTRNPLYVLYQIHILVFLYYSLKREHVIEKSNAHFYEQLYSKSLIQIFIFQVRLLL